MSAAVSSDPSSKYLVLASSPPLATSTLAAAAAGAAAAVASAVTAGEEHGVSKSGVVGIGTRTCLPPREVNSGDVCAKKI
jgi:hypothetical protein